MNVSATVSPEDSRMVRRIVGFLEYGKSLEYFDELMRISSSDEIKVVDQIIRDNEAFAIYSNLSRMVEVGHSTLVEHPSSTDQEYVQRGLAWVVALARVEFSAMLATYGNQHVFNMMRPTNHELGAYKSLLLDGARTHYWALKTDPTSQRIFAEGRVTPVALSYIRRLRLARALVRAAMKSGVSDYSPHQLRELASWNSQLGRENAALLTMVQSNLAQLQGSIRDKRDSEFVRACSALLQAEVQEKKAGTTTTYKHLNVRK